MKDKVIAVQKLHACSVEFPDGWTAFMPSIEIAEKIAAFLNGEGAPATEPAWFKIDAVPIRNNSWIWLYLPAANRVDGPYAYTAGNKEAKDHGYTHWASHTPVPPAPPEDNRRVEDQLALTDFKKNNWYSIDLDYWHAALKWERERVAKANQLGC